MNEFGYSLVYFGQAAQEKTGNPNRTHTNFNFFVIRLINHHLCHYFINLGLWKGSTVEIGQISQF